MLLDALTVAARNEFSTPEPEPRDHEATLRRRRLVWLLDRLAPASTPELFEPFRSEELAIYGWGRRLRPDRRDELTKFPITPDTPGHWGRRMVIQALMLAWCDTCPDDQLDSILDWRDVWSRALKPHDICWLHDPEDEFYRRSTDVKSRYHVMLAALQRNVALLHEADETTHETAQTSGFRLLTYLLRDVAIQNPGAVPPQSMPDAYQSWMDSILASAPFAKLAELGCELLRIRRERGADEFLARSLWIWRHGEHDWQQLYFNSGMFRDDWISGEVLKRLAEIVPEDELETWGTLVRWDSDEARIRAFCRWLPAKYAEVLREHFNHPERDWGACAYQNYLSKAPEPMLRLSWARMEDLPGWQAALLDRRLFAPPAVRPAALIEDIQSVEGDLRLQDPFNHRAY